MQKRMTLIFMILLLLSSSTGIFITDNVKASGSTIYVDDGGGTDYANIQDAIDAANPGDIVYVYSGFYPENLVINKTVSLICEDKTNTTIDGSGNDVVSVSADHVEIHSFTIKNGTNGIMINGSSETIIAENTITDTEYGIYIDNKSANNTIYNNNFLSNIQNAYDLSTNIWHYASNGNYWDDYVGIDSDDNGIGDIPYNISGGNNQDIYPLMEPITELPNADFTYLPSNPTTQDVIQFNDISTDLDGYIVSWSWDFGDGNTSTKQNATHKYADNGIYSITLKVTDNYGATGEIPQQLSVLNVGPTADFDYSPSNPTDLQNVVFADKSSDLDGDIVNWSWDFGDGNTSKLQSPSYRYGDNGTYPISLTITDDDGSTDVTSQQISVSNVAPTVSFSFSSTNITVLVNDEVKFNDNSKDLDGTIISWKWDLGDGATSTERNPVHNYTNKGTYTVSLTVTDNDGALSTETKYLTVSVLLEPHELVKGFSTFDIVFVVFLIIMVGVVIFLSRKYS